MGSGAPQVLCVDSFEADRAVPRGSDVAYLMLYQLPLSLHLWRPGALAMRVTRQPSPAKSGMCCCWVVSDKVCPSLPLRGACRFWATSRQC